jgi:hypothetical protein
MATMPLIGANDFPIVCVGGSAGGLAAAGECQFVAVSNRLP